MVYGHIRLLNWDCFSSNYGNSKQKNHYFTSNVSNDISNPSWKIRFHVREKLLIRTDIWEISMELCLWIRQIIPGVRNGVEWSNISRNLHRIRKLKNAYSICLKNLTNDTRHDPYPRSLGWGSLKFRITEKALYCS